MSVADVTVVMDRAYVARHRTELQTALASDDPAVAFLAVLTTKGVRDLPTFAYLEIEGGSARILLRGDVVAIARSGDGTTSTVAAGAVSTWTEVVRDNCVEIEVRSPPGGANDIVTVVSFNARPLVGRSESAVANESMAMDRAAPIEAPTAGLASKSVADETMVPRPEPIHMEAPADDGSPHDDDRTAAIPVVTEGIGSDDVDLSHLFETTFFGVEAAAVRPEEPPSGPVVEPDHAPSSAIQRPELSQLAPPSGASVAAPPPPLISGIPSQAAAPPSPASLGDHDGLTIAPAALAALRGVIPAEGGRASSLVTGARVQAVSCPSGHLNPPHADVCRTCRSPIADRAVQVVARPSLGRLLFDSGLVSEIDRPLRIGRKPTTEGVAPTAEIPGLVVLPDPEGSLSRVHAEVRIEGWEVLLVDQDSTNGTLVEIPGQPPVRLRPMDPYLLTSGSRINFAYVAGCRFETGPR